LKSDSPDARNISGSPALIANNSSDGVRVGDSGTRVHRSDLDGLRGMAVLGVFIYHLEPSWLPGGFVGVDVFFVLSGYLITGILLPSIYQKTFSFGIFFQRRIARIFPALAAMLLAVLVLSHWFYPKEDIASIGSAAAAASAGLANMKFMMQGSYFRIIPDTQPLLHTWSLGVEEQYYMCVPILLVALRRLSASIRTLRIVLWSMAIASFFLCVAMTSIRPTIAFYLMPLRAWELLFGAILAASEFQSGTCNTSRARFVGYALGICGILACMFMISDQWPFPGWVAMLPVAFTVQSIADGVGGDTNLVKRWVSSGPMTWLGKLSYSLYLWHWPVFCFVDYTLLDRAWEVRFLLKIVLAFGFSLLSYQLLEAPIRLQLGRKDRGRIAFSVFSVVSVLVAAIGVWSWRTEYLNASVSSIASGGIKLSGGADGPIVVLYGDSIGSSQATALSEVVKNKGGTLYVTSCAGSKPLPPSTNFDNLIRFLGTERVDFVIIACTWYSYEDQPAKISNTLRILEQTCDSRIFLVGPTPLLPKSASRDQMRQKRLIRVEEPEENRARRLRVEEMLSKFETSTIKVLNSSEIFLEDLKWIRFYTPQGWQSYQDYLHLSSYGSRMLWNELNTEELFERK